MTAMTRFTVVILLALPLGCAESPPPPYDTDRPTAILQHQSGPMFEPAPPMPASPPQNATGAPRVTPQ
jgi:hypothetical protein